MQIDLPDVVNVYVKAIDKTFAMDISKVPQERILRGLIFGWQTMLGNARNGAGQGASKAQIEPFITKKAEQQYTAIEAGTTGQRAVDPVEREVKRLARDLATQWLTKNGKNKKDNASEFDAKVLAYSTNPKVVATAQANVAAKSALSGLED